MVEWDSAGGTAHLGPLLGFRPGDLVLEIGRYEGCDAAIRSSLEGQLGQPLLDPDTDEVVDGVLLWFRDGDGDLTDSLVSAVSSLAKGGKVWLFTPKVGRIGHIPPADIQEAAIASGLSQGRSVSAGNNWSGTALNTPKTTANLPWRT